MHTFELMSNTSAAQEQETTTTTAWAEIVPNDGQSDRVERPTEATIDPGYAEVTPDTAPYRVTRTPETPLTTTPTETTTTEMPTTSTAVIENVEPATATTTSTTVTLKMPKAADITREEQRELPVVGIVFSGVLIAGAIAMRIRANRHLSKENN